MSYLTQNKVCPKCGSKNICSTNSLPLPQDASFLRKLQHTLSGMATGDDPRLQRGEVYIVCRDCGQIINMMRVM